MTRFGSARIDVRPHVLEEAVRYVSSRWAGGDEELSDAEYAARVRHVRGLVNVTAAAGRSLGRRDARFAARMCVSSQESHEWKTKALGLTLSQGRPLGLNLLLEVYQHCYWSAPLREHLSTRCEEREERKLPFPREHAELLFADDPPLALSRYAGAQGTRLLDLAVECRLTPSGALAKATMKKLLYSAPATWYQGLTVEEVTYALEQVLVKHHRMGVFLDAVVQACSLSEWSVERLDTTPYAKLLFDTVTMPENLGTPASHESRWSDVSVGTRDLVHWWINTHEISKFFDRVDATPERKDFWKRAARVIRDLQDYPFCCMFAMRIGTYYFVEFGRHGNACYIYDIPTFEAIKRVYDERTRSWGETNVMESVSLWKRQDLVKATAKRLGIGFDLGEWVFGRLIHNSGWQFDFDSTIRKLTGESIES